jgi:hypothetical protein
MEAGRRAHRSGSGERATHWSCRIGFAGTVGNGSMSNSQLGLSSAVPIRQNPAVFRLAPLLRVRCHALGSGTRRSSQFSSGCYHAHSRPIRGRKSGPIVQRGFSWLSHGFHLRASIRNVRLFNRFRSHVAIILRNISVDDRGNALFYDNRRVWWRRNLADVAMRRMPLHYPSDDVIN